MRTITLDRARDDLVKVAEEAARAPVRIEDAGGHNVVVMSDELYGRLHRILVQQLKESMDRIGEEAAARGLTEEKLDELLADES